MNNQPVLHSLFPDTAKRTIKGQIYQYKHGTRGSYWDTGHHKKNVSRSWQNYANTIIAYPNTVCVDGNEYHLVDVSCGMRQKEDRLLLIRELTEEFVYGVICGRTKRDWEWASDTIFYDGELDKYFHFTTVEAAYTEDECFMRYWMSSVEELIATYHWDDAHVDNSIRKLVRRFERRKMIEQSEQQEQSIEAIMERRLDVDMCGRCYKHRCCCDNAASRELSYTVNPHSMTVDVCKWNRTLSLSMEEVAELYSFLGSAATKIKEAKLAELEAQAAEIAKKLEEVKAL